MLLAFSSLVQNADSFTNNSNKTCAYDVTESHNSLAEGQHHGSPMATVLKLVYRDAYRTETIKKQERIAV